MAKKKKDAAIEAAEREAAARMQAITEFNAANAGKYWIDPDRTPTEEDAENAKREFEEKSKALAEKKDYLVADKENALRVAKFMKDFVSNGFWTQRGFVGVLNFVALMDDFINNFDENNPKELLLEYAPMQFAFVMFENYAGVGVEQANRMAEIWDEYLPIYERLHELVDWYNNEVNKIEDIKNKWGMFEQGFYLVILDDNVSNNEPEQ